MATKRLAPGQRLKRWRTSNDMQQAEVAKCFGVTVSAVSEWERGTRTPRLPTLVLMARMDIMPVDAWVS